MSESTMNETPRMKAAYQLWLDGHTVSETVYKTGCDLERELNQSLERERLLKEQINSPRKHVFWGAGEADCPADILAPNHELHTLQCKVCGLKSPRNPTCISPAD